MLWNNLNYDNSKVTVDLDDLLKSGVDPWAFDYPSFYQGEDKTAFEQKVLDHYRFRQIGQETPARWLHYFRTRIREIMPYYIQLYKTVELMEAQDDPFKSYDLTETYTEDFSNSGSVSGSSSDTSETLNTSQITTNNTRKFSDTPQGTINNIEKYMTEHTSETGSNTGNDTSTVEGSNTSETTSEGSGTVTHTLRRTGNIGVQPLGQEINAYRSALINVDLQIINELNDLFIQIY